MDYKSNLKPLIYVVDDSRLAIGLLSEILSRLECDFHTFLTPEACISAAETGPPPMILITDYNMPNMDGLELIQYFKREHGDRIYTILITSLIKTDILIKAINYGVSRFIAKPFDFEMLQKTLDEAMLYIRESLMNKELIEEISLKNHELNDQQFKLKSIFENMNDAIVLLDKNKNIEELNKKTEEIFSLNKQELIGKHYKSIINNKNIHVIPSINDNADKNKSSIVEMMIQSESSDVRYVSAYFKDFHDVNGKVQKTVVTLHDVTDSKHKESILMDQATQLETEVSNRTQELMMAKEAAEKANQSKSEFLANMSHELRTPMHAITSYSSLISKKVNNGEVKAEKISKYAQHIEVSANRLLSLINMLLDMSKLEAGKMEFNPRLVDIKAICENSVQELKALADDKNISFNFVGCEGDILIQVDPTLMSLVFINLLSNAIKFSADCSVITITFYRKESAGLEFSIEDQGVGIPKEELDYIFEKFSQSSKTKTGKGGTGLGLNICKEMIDLHGGKIWAENTTGSNCGSKFSVFLPG